MKQAFFALLALAVPLLLLGGLVYMFLHGMYRLAEDWRLDRELGQLRQDAQRRRGEQPPRHAPSYDPLTAFDDRPPAPEPPGLAVLPLDPDWNPAPEASADESDDTPLEPPHESAPAREEN